MVGHLKPLPTLNQELHDEAAALTGTDQARVTNVIVNKQCHDCCVNGLMEILYSYRFIPIISLGTCTLAGYPRSLLAEGKKCVTSQAQDLLIIMDCLTSPLRAWVLYGSLYSHSHNDTQGFPATLKHPGSACPVLSAHAGAPELWKWQVIRVSWSKESLELWLNKN